MQGERGRTGHQLGGDEELLEEIGNGPVKAAPVPMSRDRNPFTAEVTGRERTDPGQPMAGADERHPRL